MIVKKAAVNDSPLAAKLALLLWSNHSLAELEQELRSCLASDAAAIFLAFERMQAVGFAQCQLRMDYVEGTSGGPVGYLEGIFVKEAFRGQGIAGQLLYACEQWAKEQGCTEFASDCPQSNRMSHAFHLRTGFREAARIICFTKTL